MTYVALIEGKELIVFIIQAVFKRKEVKRYRPFSNVLGNQTVSKEVIEDDQEFDEMNCI